MHLKTGAPEVPVWLFATAEPLPETRALCERVYVCRGSLFLFFQAQIRLWPYWVAIAVSTWTAEQGRWPVKLAPFFIPPFRVLLLNSWGGFFPGKPALVLLHGRRFLLGAAISGWTRVKEISAGCWLLMSYHIWLSSPVRRVWDVASGFSLFALATVLKWLSYPYRGWFKGMYGDESLEADESISGCGMDHFVQKVHVWDARGFADFVQSSGAR